MRKNTLIKFAKKLFPIYRSLTGRGNRKTQKNLKVKVHELNNHKLK